MHLPIMMKKLKSINKILLFSFIGFSIIFIVMLFFLIVHDTMTGISSNSAEYCAKYGFLASPDC
jgi:hypothetical protein